MANTCVPHGVCNSRWHLGRVIRVVWCGVVCVCVCVCVWLCGPLGQALVSRNWVGIMALVPGLPREVHWVRGVSCLAAGVGCELSWLRCSETHAHAHAHTHTHGIAAYRVFMSRLVWLRSVLEKMVRPERETKSMSTKQNHGDWRRGGAGVGGLQMRRFGVRCARGCPTVVCFARKKCFF